MEMTGQMEKTGIRGTKAMTGIREIKATPVIAISTKLSMTSIIVLGKFS